MNWTAKVGFIGGLTLALAACSSPNNHYYMLSEAGDPAATPAPTAGRVLAIDQISLPAYLDRPQIVVRDGETRVDIHEYERWAEPLDGMIRRVLVADLARRLGPGRVADSAGGGADSVSITIVEFGENAGHAVLRGAWTVKSKAAPGPEHSFSFDLPVAAPDPASAVQALSQLLANLSEDIARGS